MNNLQPHQLKVLVEKQYLDDRLEKLKQFLVSPTFMNLDEDEKVRMRLQSLAMDSYSLILKLRIDAFNNE